MKRIIILLISFCITFSLFANGQDEKEYDVSKSLLVYNGETADTAVSNLEKGFTAWIHPPTAELNKVLTYNTQFKEGYDGKGNCLEIKWDFNKDRDAISCGLCIEIGDQNTGIDLQEYSGIQFYAKGKGLVEVTIPTLATKIPTNHFRVINVKLSDEWQLFTFHFKNFRQPPWGTRKKFDLSGVLGFEILTGANESRLGFINIDNISFVKLEEKSQFTAETNEEKKTDLTTNNKEKYSEFKGKHIAVVGINARNIDEFITDALLDFIINAFVNEGTMKVVDRSSIEKILSEQEFQTQDFTDTEKVIQIGKIAGAEYIVVGSLTSVGDEYYLNIKLISVKTAEIIGSSITRAKDSSNFFDMSNEAVKMLFSD